MHLCLSDKRTYERENFASISPGIYSEKCMTYLTYYVTYFQNVNEIEDEARMLQESNSASFDVILKTNIEGIIVKWGHQVTLSDATY